MRRSCVKTSIEQRSAPRLGKGVCAEQVAELSKLIGYFLPNGATLLTRPSLRLLVLPLALGSLGCSVQVENFENDVDLGLVHAIVQIRRVEMYDDQPHGDALAAFVRVPPSADPEQLLDLAGLRVAYPDVGRCAVKASSFDVLGEDVPTAELLAANTVELRTNQGLHQLAPHAFPSAYDLVRGVVYSSRDQQASDLPENEDYLLEILGIELDELDHTTDLRSRQLSPAFPAGVRILGQRFEDIETVPLQPVLDFSWESSPVDQDLMVVSISTADLVYECTFEDKERFGSVPLVLPSDESVWPGETTASVAVHRVRTSYDDHPKLANVGVGFDFSLEKTWKITAHSAPLAGALADEQAPLTTRDVELPTPPVDPIGAN